MPTPPYPVDDRDTRPRVEAFNVATTLAWVTFDDGTRQLIDFGPVLWQFTPEFNLARRAFKHGLVQPDGSAIRWASGLTISARALRGDAPGQRAHPTWPVVLERQGPTASPRPLSSAMAWLGLSNAALPNSQKWLDSVARVLLELTAKEFAAVLRAYPIPPRRFTVLRLLDLAAVVAHKYGDVGAWLRALVLPETPEQRRDDLLRQGHLSLLENWLRLEVGQDCLRALAEP